MKGILRGIGYYLFYIVIFFVLQVSFSAGSALVGTNKGITDNDVLMNLYRDNSIIMTMVSLLLVAAFMVVLVKVNNPEINKEIKLNTFSLRNLLLTIVTALAFGISGAELIFSDYCAAESILLQSYSHFAAKSPLLGTILLGLTLLVVMPTAYEISFRGVLYTRMAKDSNPIVAFIVSGIMYGALLTVMCNMNFPYGIYGALMGILFGIVLYNTNSVWLSIIAHAVADIPIFILIICPCLRIK